MANHIQKYNLKDRGLNLEKNNPLKAISYYNDLKNHEYFQNDYYPYRRLVLMYEKTGDDKNKANTIKEFFKSGIYCNKNNYLWFKYKLKNDNITTEAEIKRLTRIFKENSLKNRNLENTPLPIADRIRKRNKKIIVESPNTYAKKQKQYEYELRARQLNHEKKYEEYIGLLNYMIDNLNYRRFDYFKKLCIAYRRVKDKDSEIQTIERYFNGESTHTKASDKWFEKRYEELIKPEISINLKDADLSKNPFYEYNKKLDTQENLRRKSILIKYGKNLDYTEAIAYYKYLCNNTYFKNDWYPYHQLTLIYDEIGDVNANLVNIKKVLQSKIYLNEYQFLFFSDKIRELMGESDIDEETVQKWFDEYEIHGSINRFKLNKYLADKFIFENDEVTILKDDEFNHIQERLALREKGCIYERVGNYELAITHYVKIINDKEFNYFEFYKRLYACLDKIKDYKREVKAINLYYKSPPLDRDINSDEYIERRLDAVNGKINEK